ncbi:MAG: outer membrane lipoprotein carrier protein LolA, partial [Elusimicrobiota bacterium]|nr:outer membrane lipoprotein carrier protein LolA [Elusimicrobiota bacterium]
KSFARRFATFLYAFVSMDFDVLQKAYDVEFRDDRIVFLPKKTSDAPKKIEVFYNQKGEVDKVLFYAKNGDLTTIIFTNVKINEALPEDAFSI